MESCFWITLHNTEVWTYFLRDSTAYKETCSNNFFLVFISSCCVVTYQNKTSVTGAITRCARNYSGICEKILTKLGNSFFNKFKI